MYYSLRPSKTPTSVQSYDMIILKALFIKDFTGKQDNIQNKNNTTETDPNFWESLNSFFLFYLL